MAEETTVRTIETISNEYGQLCAVLGDKVLKIEILSMEIQKTKEKIFALDQEAKALKASEAK